MRKFEMLVVIAERLSNLIMSHILLEHVTMKLYRVHKNFTNKILVLVEVTAYIL